MTSDIQLPVPLWPGTFLAFLDLPSPKEAPSKSRGIRTQAFLPLPAMLVIMSLASHGLDHKIMANPGVTTSAGCRKIKAIDAELSEQA